MKSIVTYILLLFCILNVNAKSVPDMFISMPDTLMPYITKEQRVDLVNMKNIDPATPAELNTIFKNDIVINSMSEYRIEIAVGDLHYDIVRLHTNNETDSLYCVLCTVPTPTKETTCTLYDEDWQTLRYINIEKEVVQSLDNNETDRDTYEKMEMPITYAILENDKITLNVELKDGLPLRVEKAEEKALVLQRKLKWNGKSFKEY